MGGNIPGGIFPGGNFPGESLMGGNFTGVNFPRRGEAIFLKPLLHHLAEAIQSTSTGSQPLLLFLLYHAGYLSRAFKFTRQQRKGESISLTLLYHLHLLHRHLNTSRPITAKSLPLHIASSWTRSGDLWFCKSLTTKSRALITSHHFDLC